MPVDVNATHDPARRSWVGSANDPDTDFPVQNLPFGVFRANGRARGGVALGTLIIDLGALIDKRILSGGALEAARVACGTSLAPLLTLPEADVGALRARLSDLFRADGEEGYRSVLTEALVPMAQAELLLPMKPPAFTDFCTSMHHIRRMSGTPDAPPRLACMSLPVAYNGRASSVVASSAPVIRPNGQFELSPGSGNVRFGPEPMLDFELEFGAWLRGGNAIGEPVSVAQAEEQLFGCCLVNDWSARSIQFFEMILGPHLGKSFLTTVSPWVVTMEALAPFRTPAPGRGEGEPAVLPHLFDPSDQAQGGINIELTADLLNAAGSVKRIVRTNLTELYWTLAQMVAHQASNGAPLEAGDLIATGTVSGRADDARACMAEITARGARPIEMPDGTRRVMLEDGDTVTLRGRAHADGYISIGFGDCSGTIQAARRTA
jgi:fumarylacetoacetase